MSPATPVAIAVMIASMGPRHKGRGNMMLAEHITKSGGSFNGAASQRTRKWHPWHVSVLSRVMSDKSSG